MVQYPYIFSVFNVNPDTTAEGTQGFASEDDIRTCFTDAGYTQGIAYYPYKITL
jgi:hypothetical protein